LKSPASQIFILRKRYTSPEFQWGCLKLIKLSAEPATPKPAIKRF